MKAWGSAARLGSGTRASERRTAALRARQSGSSGRMGLGDHRCGAGRSGRESRDGSGSKDEERGVGFQRHSGS